MGNKTLIGFENAFCFVAHICVIAKFHAMYCFGIKIKTVRERNAKFLCSETIHAGIRKFLTCILYHCVASSRIGKE